MKLINTFTKYDSKICFEILIDEGLTNHFLLSIANDFESKQWRSRKFKNFIINNLKETALSKKEKEALIGKEGSILDKAVSNMRIDDQGGEIGEIFLYGVMREYYNALPVVPKIFYKQNSNDYAKGADSVHITLEGETYHIWLGESKFYKDINQAIDEAMKSVKGLFEDNKLRKERSIITDSNDFEHLKNTNAALKLKNILDDRISLDEIKKILHIPISVIHECKKNKRLSLL